VNPFTDIHKKFASQILSCSRQSPTNVKITPIDAVVCSFEAMKSVLKRIHRGISERSAIPYSAAQTRVYQCLSFTLQRSNAYSISLQSTVEADSASSFYDRKILTGKDYITLCMTGDITSNMKCIFTAFDLASIDFTDV
jgi:hypothetical protein